MKFAKLTSITAIALFTVLALPLHLAAQEHHAKHHPYRPVDIGTFGGPISSFVLPSPGGQAQLVGRTEGIVAGVGSAAPDHTRPA